MTKTDFDDIDEEKQESQISWGKKEKREDVEDGFSHVIKKGMKHLERVFLERKLDSDNLCTIPKKPKSAFFFRESDVLVSTAWVEKETFWTY